MTDAQRYSVIDSRTGRRVHEGDTVVTFRDETVTFVGIVQNPKPGSGGKVECRTPGVEYRDIWYPSVVNLRIVRSDQGLAACEECGDWREFADLNDDNRLLCPGCYDQ